MGIYAEYLDKAFDWPAFNIERKKQLKQISDVRNRPVLVYASAITKDAPVSIGYEDRISFLDQAGRIPGNKLDLILKTPGGSAEVVEDLVKNLRGKFSELAIIVPGWAKSPPPTM
jgi:ClpP class serine protease